MNSTVYKSPSTPLELISVPLQRRTHSNLLSRAADVLNTWNSRHRQRQRLMQLDERLLKDVGISYEDVWAEVNKPFWRR